MHNDTTSTLTLEAATKNLVNAIADMVTVTLGRTTSNQPQVDEDEPQVDEDELWARQEEINEDHYAEHILDLDESIRLSYTGTGRTTGEDAFPMRNFNGYGSVPSGYSLRLAVAKLFREAPAIESVVITYNNEVYDAHARENRQVLLTSQDDVYRALVSLDEEAD